MAGASLLPRGFSEPAANISPISFASLIAAWLRNGEGRQRLVRVSDVALRNQEVAFHRQISAKGYRFMRPGLETTAWSTLETGVIDPFGNLIRFCEVIDKSRA